MSLLRPGKRILYKHRTHKRTRSITLRVRDGEVVVTTPPRIRRSFIEDFIRSKADWITDKLGLFAGMQRLPKESAAERRTHRAQALRIVHEKIAKLNAHYNFQYNRIAIRDQRTRWGSCSSRKNLNFNYRIVFLPNELAEYLVAHELCHLAQMNHSQAFWDLVGETIPEYKRLRAELKRIRM
jgi:predicted metal-dependent hydrolase